jgi:uncharacterized damage-inducible protein DinB
MAQQSGRPDEKRERFNRGIVRDERPSNVRIFLGATVCSGRRGGPESVREELIRLDDQARRSLDGEAWFGPAVLEALADISVEEASAHPIPGAHSIWEIVLHLAATYRLVLQRIQGHSGTLNPEQDWPLLADPSAERWKADVEELRKLNREVRLAIRTFPADRLDQVLAVSHSSAYVHLAGLPQHDAYHAGQIVLLRKALRKP